MFGFGKKPAAPAPKVEPVDLGAKFEALEAALKTRLNTVAQVIVEEVRKAGPQVGAPAGTPPEPPVLTTPDPVATANAHIDDEIAKAERDHAARIKALQDKKAAVAAAKAVLDKAAADSAPTA